MQIHTHVTNSMIKDALRQATELFSEQERAMGCAAFLLGLGFIRLDENETAQNVATRLRLMWEDELAIATDLSPTIPN